MRKPGTDYRRLRAVTGGGTPLEELIFGGMFLAFLAATVVSFLTGGPSSQNLISNPSCETIDEAGRPIGWSVYHPRGQAEWGVAEDGIDGPRSAFLRVRAYDPQTEGVRVGLLPVPSGDRNAEAAPRVAPNTRYRLSYAAKGTVSEMKVGVKIWLGGGGEQSSVFVGPRPEPVWPQWTRYELTFDTPAHAECCAPLIQIAGRAEELPDEVVLQLDDVSLVSLSEPFSDRVLQIHSPKSPPEYAMMSIGLDVWLRILGVAIGLPLLCGLLLPLRRVGWLERWLLGWGMMFFVLGVLGHLSHYLSVSGFLLTGLAIVVGIVALGWRFYGWRPSSLIVRRRTRFFVRDLAVVLLPGLILADVAYRVSAGWMFHYDMDMGDYIGRARMILAEGAFLPIDMGSPYGDHTVSAITTTNQVWHAVVAQFSGCDLIYVSLVLSLLMAPIFIGAMYFVLRSAGVRQWLAWSALPVFFLGFLLMTDYRRYAYNRAVAFVIGLLALGCLLQALRRRRLDRRLAILAVLLTATVAAVHIPRAGAVVYAFCGMATCLTLLLQRWRGAWPTVREWFVRWAALIVPAIAISALFVLPRLKSVAYLFLNPLQIAHMPTDREAKFRDFPEWWVALVFACGLAWVFAAGRRRWQVRVRGAIVVGITVTFAGVSALYLLYPHAHFRNYSEPAQFMLALLVPIPLFLAIETFLEARRSGMIAVGAGLLLVGVVAFPVYQELDHVSSVLRRRANSAEKVTSRRYVRDHATILEYVEANERDTWPRIAGDPSQTQTLANIANVRPASWRLRLPLKTQLFDFGNVPQMEACHLLNAIDQTEAALWCRRLKADYVLDDWDEMQWDQRDDRFWQTEAANEFRVADAPTNALFRPPALPDGLAWDTWESRVFRFRLDLDDLKADRAPLLLSVQCGDETLPLEDQRHWRRSFIYRFHGERNHENWGSLEQTADGREGRRIFGPWKRIHRTKSLRSAPFRMSFPDGVGEELVCEVYDDHPCRLYVEMWNGRDWDTLGVHTLVGSKSSSRLPVRLPDVALTVDAQYFPRLVPVRAVADSDRVGGEDVAEHE